MDGDTGTGVSKRVTLTVTSVPPRSVPPGTIHVVSFLHKAPTTCHPRASRWPVSLAGRSAGMSVPRE